jgi:hypothetical protein
MDPNFNAKSMRCINQLKASTSDVSIIRDIDKLTRTIGIMGLRLVNSLD